MKTPQHYTSSTTLISKSQHDKKGDGVKVFPFYLFPPFFLMSSTLRCKYFVVPTFDCLFYSFFYLCVYVVFLLNSIVVLLFTPKKTRQNKTRRALREKTYTTGVDRRTEPTLKKENYYTLYHLLLPPFIAPISSICIERGAEQKIQGKFPIKLTV